jgi:hypothetical protein
MTGSHFAMIEEDADSTAEIVETWWSTNSLSVASVG